ncbi:MAG: type III pantothenate kinase [Alphaproteobacteria bacterium]
MDFLIDCGNRNISFALWDGSRICGRWRTASDARSTADDYAIWLRGAFAGSGYGVDCVGSVIMASVVPALDWALEQVSRDLFGCEVLRVSAAVVLAGVEVRLASGSVAGEDRLANAVGASARYGGALVVVDFGTATTFDCVGSDGSYVGGVIAPGIDLSLEALHRGTARLPRTWLARPDMVVGRDTASALLSGVYWGYVSMVEGLLARISVEHSYERVIATGGQAALLVDDLPSVECADVDLTLYGLSELLRRSDL